MNTARALTVLAAACIIGAGLGLTAHAVTRDDEPKPPSGQASSNATPSATTASSTSQGSTAQPLGLGNLFTASDLQKAGFDVKKGSYVQDDANNFQYAPTPCMRTSLGQLTSANSFAAEAYEAQGSHVDEAISSMINETQAKTAAKTLVKWHTGTCPGGTRSTAQDQRDFDGGTLWTFTTNQGDIIGVIRFDDRLAVVDVSHEPSAATADKIMSAAIKRLAVASGHPAPSPSSGPSSPTPVTFIDFRTKKSPNGLSIKTAAQASALSRTSSGFERYVAAQAGKVLNPSSCTNKTQFTIEKYASSGFAVGGVGDCGGYQALWGARDGEWLQLIGTQDIWTCDELSKNDVPVGLVPDGKCLDRFAGKVITYAG